MWRQVDIHIELQGTIGEIRRHISPKVILKAIDLCVRSPIFELSNILVVKLHRVVAWSDRQLILLHILVSWVVDSHSDGSASCELVRRALAVAGAAGPSSLRITLLPVVAVKASHSVGLHTDKIVVHTFQ